MRFLSKKGFGGGHARTSSYFYKQSSIKRCNCRIVCREKKSILENRLEFSLVDDLIPIFQAIK